MRFRLIARLDPPSFFGLPEEGKTVLPVGLEFAGEAIDTRTGARLTHGTLSHYRQESEPLRLTLTGHAIDLEAHDNYLKLACEAPSRDEAIKQLTSFLERFVRHLAAEQGELFRAEILQLEDALGNVSVHNRQHVARMSVTRYSLDELAGRMTKCYPRASVTDRRLDRALLYYEHARFLFNMRGHADPFSAHHGMMLASAFLNLWKALSAIIGERGTDKDYQRRYRTFGLPTGFWADRVEPLYRIRCDEDVAHYSLDADAPDQIAKSFGDAALTCRDVIAAYTDTLVSSASGTVQAV